MSFLKRIKKQLIKVLGKDVIHPQNNELLNIFSGFKTAHILGSAPSINKIDLKRFDENDLVISMGNFHEHRDILEINPQIHIFAASHSPITEEVLEKWWLRSHNRLPQETVILAEKKDMQTAKTAFKGRKVYYYSYGGEFPIDFTKRVVSPGSVAQIAMQLCVYLNVNTINFYGINHDWQKLKPYKHFYDHSKPSLEYYLNEASIVIPYEQMKPPLPKKSLYYDYHLYQGYEQIKVQAESKGLNIFNADSSSHFDVFEFSPNIKS